MNSPSTEKLTIGRFTFATDACGELLPVPSDHSLKGYVVYENGQSDCSRIHILANADQSEQERYRELWEAVRRGRSTSIFPAIIDCGSDDGIPYYVSKFPHGVPLSVYLEESPAWPGQLAARVLGRFIGSLRFQNQFPLHEFVISYDSLWIEKTIYGPRLLIGDITVSSGGNGSLDNAALMLSVFKDLTKEEHHDPAIAELFEKIGKGPMSLSHVEKALKNFSISGDSRKIDWTEKSEPKPFLSRCMTKIDSVSGGSLNGKKEPGRVRKLSKRRSKEMGRTEKHLITEILYRPAIELDPSSRSYEIPPRVIAFLSMAAILVILFCLSLLTSRGKALFDGIAGKFGDLTYQPNLVITPTPEERVGGLNYQLVSKYPIPLSPDKSKGQPEIMKDESRDWEESVNTFSVSD